MKTNQKALTGKEKFELAKKTIIEALQTLNFRVDVIGEFIWSLYEKEKDIREIIEKIEHGVCRYSSISARGDYRRRTDRMEIMYIRSCWQMVGTYFKCQIQRDGEDNLINGLKLDTGVLGKKHKHAREVIQLCFLQIIAHDKDISSKDFNEYRQLVEYIRRELDLNRVELALANRHTYSHDIRHVELFIRILEERVTIWNKNAKTTKRKSK